MIGLLQSETIFSDGFCIYGMSETVRLLDEINHPRATELARQLSDYRACLRERYLEARDRARRVPLSDGTNIPFVPRDVYEPARYALCRPYRCFRHQMLLGGQSHLPMGNPYRHNRHGEH